MQKKSKNTLQPLPKELLKLGYPDFLAMNTWSSSETSLPAPAFPTFSELVQREADERANPKTERTKGLFEALIGDPRILYQELLEDPNRFDSSASQVIQELATGARKLEDLNPEEHELLNAATLDFSRPRRPQPSSKPTVTKSPEMSTAAKHLAREKALADPTVDLVHQDGGKPTPLSEETAQVMPAERPTTFWWKK